MKVKIFIGCIFYAHLIVGQQTIDLNKMEISQLQGDWPSVKALSFLDKDTAQYNFFCANEYHRSAMALEQKKAFITYLKEGKGLDKLVIELPYAYGYWINKYLETGDTTLLRTVTSKWWAYDKLYKNLEISHDSYGFFIWLYHFNKKQDKGIKVVGVDLDEVQNAALELWSVQQFISKDSLYKYFKKSYPQLIKIVNTDKPGIGAVKKWRTNFSSELKTSEIYAEKVLGSEYYEFEKIISGIDDVIERYSIKNKDRRRQRETVLIRNFKREIEPTDIIYVQFGAGHLFLHNDDLYEYRKFDYLMTSVEKDPKYKGQSLNVYVHCAECELGISRTAYKPYRLMEKGGYTSHPPIDGYMDTNLHIKIDSLLQNRSSYIDLRKSSGELKQLANLYQYLVVLF